MNNEIEKLEVKKILDNLEYVSDIHKVFIEDGYKIQEEIPSSQIKELRLNSYSAKLLFNHISNLQSKIDKVIEILGQYKHLSSPTEEQANEQEEIVSNAYDILKEDK